MPEPGRRRSSRYWLRMTMWYLCAAVLAVVIFSGASLNTPWRQLIEPFGVSVLFTTCIGPLMAFAMPRVAPLLWQRFRFPLQWAIAIALMVVIAMAGSTIAIAILTAIGYIRADEFFEWFAGSFKVSVTITLIFGVLGTATEALRAQLDATTLALRTKERDEAEARRLVTEAQLASLESRVQPHFLFNTLNSISALIHEDPAGAERMTGQLAALMRSSLDQQPIVRLDEELRTVRNYLEIEGVRFGDRLRFTLDVPAGIDAILVPRLSLQTLVENSIKFAVSPRRDGASVAIRAVASNDHVRLEVEDDGPGFDASVLREGHGLDLLRSRLAMTFGARAALHLDSRPGFTRVALDVPFESRIPNPDPRIPNPESRIP